MKIHDFLNVLVAYFERHLVPSMADEQEFVYYALAEALSEEADSIASVLTSNPILRIFVAVDKDGNVNHEKLIRRLRKAMERKGKLPITVPLYGPVTFYPEDLDELGAMLEEVSKSENGA